MKSPCAKTQENSEPSSGRVSRRSFLETTSAAAIGFAFPRVIPASVLGKEGQPPPSERIHLGIIGVNGMGRANLDHCAQYPDVVVTAICDVWQKRREAVLAKFPGAKGYRDYRELLARPDLDAVIIATPPHWHALMAIDAVRAGKDIYVQKPMTLYPDETLALRNAVRKHKRVSQVGTQIHAGSNYRRVVEWIRSGRLGPVSSVHTFNVTNQGPGGIGHAPQESVPADLDWEMWLGPAPKRAYNRLLVTDAYHHCSFWDYSGGWTPGMAPHIIDLPIWALNLEVPRVTFCSGGRYVIDDDGDAPDTQEVTWKYDRLTMTWKMGCANSFGFDFGRGQPGRRLGIYFHALNATLFANYDRYEIVPEGEYLTDLTLPEPVIPDSPGHEREWLDCIKSRQEPSCSVEYHWRIDLAINLANVSFKAGRSVSFDPRTEKIIEDRKARKLARPEYRAPWKFP
ncbi:MAG: Gfo/Idh/MocA family oxidoreductase, partial [Verrucomicrobiota bacterium]